MSTRPAASSAHVPRDKVGAAVDDAPRAPVACRGERLVEQRRLGRGQAQIRGQHPRGSLEWLVVAEHGLGAPPSRQPRSPRPPNDLASSSSSAHHSLRVSVEHGQRARPATNARERQQRAHARSRSEPIARGPGGSSVARCAPPTPPTPRGPGRRVREGNRARIAAPDEALGCQARARRRPSKVSRSSRSRVRGLPVVTSRRSQSSAVNPAASSVAGSTSSSSSPSRAVKSPRWPGTIDRAWRRARSEGGDGRARNRSPGPRLERRQWQATTPTVASIATHRGAEP